MEWRLGPDLPTDGRAANGVQFEDTFLIVGGERYNTNVLEFEPATETWKIREEKLPIGRQHHSAFLVPGSYLNCV